MIPPMNWRMTPMPPLWVTEPACGVRSPATRRTSVVLPAPFGPISATVLPSPARNETSSSSTRPSGSAWDKCATSTWPTGLPTSLILSLPRIAVQRPDPQRDFMAPNKTHRSNRGPRAERSRAPRPRHSLSYDRPVGWLPHQVDHVGGQVASLKGGGTPSVTAPPATAAAAATESPPHLPDR